MGLKFTGLIVSKNFRWHEQDGKFRDVRTDTLRSDSDYEAKLDVFEDRVQGWFLDWSTSLLGQDNFAGDYVAISVALAYIEGVEQYRQGRDARKRETREWFLKSAKEILLGIDEPAIKMLYGSARNGLFHSGFTSGRVYLSYAEPIALALTTSCKLRINPRLFVQSVVKDFSAYVEDLRQSSSSQAAKRFEKLWDKRWENS